MEGLPTGEECKERMVSSVPAPPMKPLAHNDLFNTNGEINLPLLKKHLFLEGRLLAEDFIQIVKGAMLLLKNEPNLLRLKSPMTSLFFFFFLEN